jgi:ATP-dependent Lhr-like helicase
MHRIDLALGRKVPRIGLSATLGDMRLAADFLRPGAAEHVVMVESRDPPADLMILVRGYEEPLVVKATTTRMDAEGDGDGDGEASEEPSEPVTPAHIANRLYKTLHGSNNLVFPNSRREVERYSHLLASICERAGISNEFWPHHGSLSKEIRSETERALKQKEHPASANCTNTLELGIDIGAVKSVSQIGPPPTVASLRQRLGRSGRRKSEPAILWGYCVQQALDQRSSLSEQLRLGTVQMVAMISLLVERWCEPPATKGAHLSTLVQQLLSLVAQNGGISAAQAYRSLVSGSGPFSGVTPDEFASLLRHLGQKEILFQEESGLLLHAEFGERLVNHYSFYAAFATDKEYRLVSGGRTLGTLPVSQLLPPGQNILFAGKTWCVESIDEQQRTIYVHRTSGGRPPQFSGSSGAIHTRVRQRMRELLASTEPLPYLDQTAQRFLAEGRKAYRDLELDNRIVVEGGPLVLFSWLGDAANEAIVALLNCHGMRAVHDGPMVEVTGGSFSPEIVEKILTDAASADAPPTVDALLSEAFNLEREKWDWTLPAPLLRKAFASVHLDIDGAMTWARDAFGAHRKAD